MGESRTNNFDTRAQKFQNETQNLRAGSWEEQGWSKRKAQPERDRDELRDKEGFVIIKNRRNGAIV